MNCCSADQVDSALMEPCRDCPARAHLHTRNGGAQVDTRRRHSDMPIVDLGDELFHADCWMGICARSITFLVVFLASMAAGCWWFRVPACLWR